MVYCGMEYPTIIVVNYYTSSEHGLTIKCWLDMKSYLKSIYFVTNYSNKINIVYVIDRDEWNANVRLQLKIKDLRN